MKRLADFKLMSQMLEQSAKDIISSSIGLKRPMADDETVSNHVCGGLMSSWFPPHLHPRSPSRFSSCSFLASECAVVGAMVSLVLWGFYFRG